jgi:PAS domain S-box-containing protein
MLETVRAVVMFGVIVFLVNAGRNRHTSSQRGWGLITVGFLLLFVGSVLDITDNFESLNRFVLIGDTEAEAYLEKIVGYLGGFICIAVGLYFWVPSVQQLSEEVSRRKQSELALRDSEARFKEATRIAHLGHFIWDDVENRCIDCDEEFARIHGITPEEYLSTSATFEDDLLWVHPDDRERYSTVILEESQPNRRHTNVEYRIVRRDGEIRHIVERGERVLDRIGLTIRTIGTIQDITERKQVEESLQQAHDMLERRVRDRTDELSRANAELQREIASHKEVSQELEEAKHRNELILEAAGEGIYGLDLEGRTTFVNPAAAQMVGWDSQDLIGQSQHDILHHTKPDGTPYPREHCPIYAAFKDGKVHHVSDEVFWKKDGTSFPIEYVSAPIRKGGSLVGAVVVFRDISERKRAEEALRKSEARLTAIMENAPAEIYLKDVQGRYVLINRYYERLWNVTKEGVRGKLPADIHHQKEFADAARSHDLAVLRSGEVIEQEDDILMVDGLHTLHMIKFPIRDAAGEISGLGAIATDVTESKKLDRIKDEFVSSVSHELRTPMTSVLGALGLIQGGAAGRLPEKAQSMIEITYRNCNRLVRLLNDVLDIEKMESGSSNLETSLLELGPLARDAIETIAHYSAEQGVEVRLVEDVDFVQVMADGDRLIQVLTNLLSNAIKFSPQGGVVEVRISRGDHSVRLSVKDRGPGIPEDFRNQVFERFTQADRADSRCRGGTGLGLSICKMIIDQHGGSIAFDTEIGTGTTFYFDLSVGRGEELSARERRCSFLAS